MINNSNSVYNVNYFIKKFEAIPEELWIAGHLHWEDKSCANGHCGMKNYSAPTEESMALREVFKSLQVTPLSTSCYEHEIHGSKYYSLIALNINDGHVKEYQQPTPKQRILAALYDIKKMQDIDTGAKVKELIRYVAVPVTISEQAKELVLS